MTRKIKIYPQKRVQVNVLGTKYTVIVTTKFKDDCLSNKDGYQDETAKVCVIDNYAGKNEKAPTDVDCKKNLDLQAKKNIRHELVHAFLAESGMRENSTKGWALNEEMVDWIAIQGPKIYAAWKQAGAL